MRRPLVFFVVTGALAIGSLHAQSVSKELLNLLTRGVGMGPNDNYDLRIGAPPSFPRELLPRGVTPAASTVAERMIVVVAEAPGLTGRDLSQHERDLAAAGWSSMSSMGMRGLVSSNSTPSSNFCKGDQHATISYGQRTAGGLNLRVAVTTDPRRMCAGSGPRMMSNFADVELPNLTPPAETRTLMSGSSGGTDRYDQNIRLDTKLTPDAVVKHYGDQLEAAGWKREAQAGGAGVALARFTVLSATTKETVVAVVVAAALPPDGQIAVNLQLLRVDPNRRFPGRIGGAGPR